MASAPRLFLRHKCQLLGPLMFVIYTYFLSVCLISKGRGLIHATELSRIHRPFNWSRCLNSKECVQGWDFKPESLLALKCPSLSQNSLDCAQTLQRGPHGVICAGFQPPNNSCPQQVRHRCLWGGRRAEWMKPTREVFHGGSRLSSIINRA